MFLLLPSLLIKLAAPDSPNFLGIYFMEDGTDYRQQTRAFNLLDDVIITETRRIVCYNQTIYDDIRVEPKECFGMSLGVRNNPRTTVETTVRPDYDQVSICILDNDSKCSF